jgi:hypothetical protein
VLLIAQLSSAAIIIEGGPGNFLNDENILFTVPGLTLSGNPVEGVSNNTNFIILYTSDEQLVANGGQARVEGQDGGFKAMAVQPELGIVGFTSFIMNLPGAQTDGSVTITVDQMFGSSVSATLSRDSNGANWYRIHATGSEFLTKVSFTTTEDVDDIRQVRIGGLGEYTPPQEVPEPTTMALMGVGLAAAAFMRRR